MSSPDTTLREMLIEVAPPALRDRRTGAGRRPSGRCSPARDDGVAYADAARRLGRPRRLRAGGQWAAAAQRSVKTPVDDFATRTIGELSGGERKRLVLDVLLNERRRRAAARRARQLPRRAHPRVARGADQVVPVDDPDGQPRPHAAVERRDQGDLRRGHRVLGPRRLVPHVPRGARQAPGAARRRPQALERRGAAALPPHEDHEAARRDERSNAAKANAAETRWEKFVKAGPPPPPVPDQQILVKLRGADAARRVVQLTDVSIGDLFLPFSHEIYHGERIGLIGPERHRQDPPAQRPRRQRHRPRRSDRCRSSSARARRSGCSRRSTTGPSSRGAPASTSSRDRRFDEELAMKALARYRIGRQSRQEFETLSGGQKARLEILCLELDGHNVLLLDEPTDNLDVDSVGGARASARRVRRHGDRGQPRPHVPRPARPVPDDHRRRRGVRPPRLRAGDARPGRAGARWAACGWQPNLTV